MQTAIIRSTTPDAIESFTSNDKTDVEAYFAANAALNSVDDLERVNAVATLIKLALYSKVTKLRARVCRELFASHGVTIGDSAIFQSTTIQ